MKARKLVPVAVVALGLAAAGGFARATPVFTIDQQNTIGSNASLNTLTFAQSFTPTLASLDAAFFSLRAEGGSPVTGAVSVRLGTGLAGTLLGTSTATTFSNAAFVLVEFDFASSVALNPGSVYTLQFDQSSSGSFSTEFAGGNPYGGGLAINNAGTTFPTFDNVFAEGAFVNNTPAVPEPAGVALAVTALAGLGLARRRRAGAPATA